MNCASRKVRYRVLYGFEGGRIVVLLHAALKDFSVSLKTILCWLNDG